MFVSLWVLLKLRFMTFMQLVNENETICDEVMACVTLV